MLKSKKAIFWNFLNNGKIKFFDYNEHFPWADFGYFFHHICLSIDGVNISFVQICSRVGHFFRYFDAPTRVVFKLLSLP